MEKKSFFKSPNGKDRVFRLIVCVLAILALSAAITYMIRSILLDSNATKRLLAEAFMAISKDEDTTIDRPLSSDEAAQTTEGTVQEPTPTTVALVSADLSVSRPTLANYTSYGIDEEALAAYQLKLPVSLTSPVVLILHAHPRECYAPDHVEGVEAAFNFESTDSEKNIFAVGEAVAEVLTAAGIPTLHALDESGNVEEIVNKYRTLYPSITFVLDIHRDGLYTTDGRIVRTDAVIGNTPASQLMLAVGTNQDDPSTAWQDNLAAAWQLTSLLSSSQNGIMRNILLRPESLNQQFAPCSLSLYVGTTGNTLSEALVSARYFAKYFAIFLLQL